MVWAEFLGMIGAGVLGAASVPLAFAWLRGAHVRAGHGGDPMVMAYPPALAWMGAILTVFWLGIALMSQVVLSNDTPSLKVLVVFLGFVLMGLYLVAEATLIHHRITDEGLIHRCRSGGRG